MGAPVEMRWVRTFLAVIDNQGFARAAQVLRCSQPTISSHMAALEQELGTPLFQRDRRPVELTQAGAALLPHARAIAMELDAARSSVSDVLGLRQGTVSLGAYPSATAGYVPGLLERFHQRYPGIVVRLLELRADDLATATVDGQAELIVRPTNPPLPAATFACLPLWRERYQAVLHPTHPLVKSPGPLSPKDLTDQALILTGHGELTSPEHPLWRQLESPLTVTYEVTQPQSLVELVRAGLGLGVTNQLSLHLSVTDGLVIRDIDDGAAVRDIFVWWLSRRTQSPAARALLGFMANGPRPPGVHRLG
jgi:DNA-binding transcriptional LysR family regulator